MKLLIGAAYAGALLRELGVNGIPDLLVIARHLNLTIQQVDADGFDGALVRAEGIPCGTIAVRRSIREQGRKNFTVAHEIGHFVIPDHGGPAVCSSSDIGNWCNAERERERHADEFAAELLLPSAYAGPVFRQASPSLDIIQSVAEKSGASLSATAWRYCDLVSERCAVVWAEKGKIRWYKASGEFGFFLQPGQELQKGTQAYECLLGSRWHAKPEPVSADLWLNGRVLLLNSVLWEHSIGLPFYECVLSLLWIKETIERYSDYADPEPEELDPYHFDMGRRRSRSR